MKRFIILAFFLLTFSISCIPVSLDTNDNSELYGTEWSTSDQVESLLFNRDNTVVYSCQNRSGKGSFEYDSSSRIITFDGLTVNWGTTTSVMTSAKLTDDKTMNLYWHEVGKTDNNYEIMYRRR